jgi:rubrerythrin
MVDLHDVAVLAEQGDAAILRAALELEEEAVARYVAHGSRTADPRLIAFWEALRRNEAEHHDRLLERIAVCEREGPAAGPREENTRGAADPSHATRDAAS